MHIIYYLLGSYAFIGLIIWLSTILSKYKLIQDEGSRKFIHIGVSNWYFLALIFMQNKDDIWITLIPPVTFVILNYISYKMNLIKSMERSGNGNLGTVYYPIALLILVYVTFNVLSNPYIGLMGVMVMGYGDGLAAVIGKRFGKKYIGNSKSLIGTVTMFVTSLIVAVIISTVTKGLTGLWVAFVVAVAATIIEYVTPKGLDNLSVPLGTSLIYYLFLFI